METDKVTQLDLDKGIAVEPGPNNPVGVRYVAYVQIGTGEYAIRGTDWPSWVK